MSRPTFRIRAARADEIDAVLDVERRAAVRFAALDGFAALPGDETPRVDFDDAIRECLAWAAVSPRGVVVGFAYAAPIDDVLFLEELSVIPEAGRRGIGRALVERAIAEARDRGCRGVYLTTFREVPWNAPWYRSLGFREIDPEEAPGGLRAAWANEIARGLHVRPRCLMARSVAASSSD